MSRIYWSFIVLFSLIGLMVVAVEGRALMTRLYFLSTFQSTSQKIRTELSTTETPWCSPIKSGCATNDKVRLLRSQFHQSAFVTLPYLEWMVTSSLRDSNLKVAYGCSARIPLRLYWDKAVTSAAPSVPR